MATTWKCLFCGNINDLNDQFRMEGKNTCGSCGKNRYLPHFFGILVLFSLAGLVVFGVWISGSGERNYRAKFIELFKTGNQIDSNERETLHELAKRYGLNEEKVKQIESEITQDLKPNPPLEATTEGPHPTPSDQKENSLECVFKIYRKSEGNKPVSVSPDFGFKNGDEVRLNVEPKQDGYLYLVQKGSSGRLSLLFPDKHISNGANNVKAKQSMMIPSSLWFQFDKQPGTETIFVVFSAVEEKTLFSLLDQASKEKTPDFQAKALEELQKRAKDLSFSAPGGTSTNSEKSLMLTGKGTLVGVVKLNHQ